MGLRNYLIEGVSGAGKTAVAEELERRGYDVVHGDRQFAYHGDPETGEPLEPPAALSEADRIAWGYARWIWPVDKVTSLAGERRNAISFFCGGTRNAHRFMNLFDAVFVLEVDSDTLTRRLARRPEDEFGGKPAERALIARVHATKEGLPENGVRIDATRPVTEIVDDILKRCGERG